MPAGGLVVAGVIGAATLVSGIIAKNKAKKEAAKLAASRPKYAPSPDYRDAVQLAKSEVSTGMSGEAKNAYEQGIDRNLSTSLSAILKSGGSANNVAEVFDVANQGRQKLAMMKDNLRLNQINQLVRAQQMNSEEREKGFQFNEWAPWADSAKANAGAREAADQQINSGISTIGGAAMSFAGAKGGASKLGNYFSQAGAEQAAPQRIGGSNNSPGLADISGGRSNFAPNQISPYIQDRDFSTVNQNSMPDISTFE